METLYYTGHVPICFRQFELESFLGKRTLFEFYTHHLTVPLAVFYLTIY
jgi:predicted membrane-bound dolichyl-phosphate-mannose-protein mannosyltransferase